MKEIKRIDKINEYIEASIISIRCNIKYFDDIPKPDWKRLNDFLSANFSTAIDMYAVRGR